MQEVRAGTVPRVSAADIGGANQGQERRETGAGRTAHIGAEEREPSPALSAVAQARADAQALYYQLSKDMKANLQKVAGL